MNNDINSSNYGEGDASFNAAGGVEGINKLVNAFYDAMETLPQAQHIREMHSQNLDESRDKLTRFLAGWLGGPKLFSEKYGPIRIPVAHRHLSIGPAERDAWLACMQIAINEQPYPQEFRDYFMKQIYVPAERSRNKD
ncbi:MAG TPA: globin [Oceanospirillales bacterium]|jgi:hemoglobin|nr:globin [Oleispira sp.]HCM04995.1 globin [Oceanospirillales bacterium]|tara:strand:+ start:2012 stop:2425 length:414 start_codon:yes stop_codon:yes gene_type:complete